MKRSFTQLILALIFFGVVLAGYAAWYFSVQKESAVAAQLASQIDDQSKNSTRSAAAQKALASLSLEQAEIEGHFIATQDVVPFLESLQKMGTTLGTVVSVGSVAADPSPRPHLVLSLSIKGSFDGIMRTLGAIEYEPYDIRVTSFSINNAPSDTGTSTWSGAMNMSVGMVGQAGAVIPTTQHAPSAKP
jgi:hypothetical protein